MDLPTPYHPGFVRWLRECLERGGLHGSVLVDRNCEHAAGRFVTTPADADDDLRKAEERGWIVRGRCTPTVSQRAFLGLTYGRGPLPASYGSCWFWEVAPRGTAARTAALVWMKAREATLFGVHGCAVPGCLVPVARAGATCDRTDPHHA